MKLTLFILLSLLSTTLKSQSISENYKIYDTRSKNICSLEEMIGVISKNDVIFFGEEHNDPTGHQLEMEIFKMLHQKNGGDQVLSMEMFETDVQLVLNEYLQNLINEKNFKKEARTWNNYTDYKLLIEYARENRLPVIAANSPNRYVNMVTRKGLTELNLLGRESTSWLPPLPVDTATGRYYDSFIKALGGHSMPGMQIYQSQNLWDAGMAYSISRHLKKSRGKNIFHLNGRFHSDEKLGAAAQLKKYSPKLKVANISCFSDTSFAKPDWDKVAHLADFVIITNPEVKRSF